MVSETCTCLWDGSKVGPLVGCPFSQSLFHLVPAFLAGRINLGVTNLCPLVCWCPYSSTGVSTWQAASSSSISPLLWVSGNVTTICPENFSTPGVWYILRRTSFSKHTHTERETHTHRLTHTHTHTQVHTQRHTNRYTQAHTHRHINRYTHKHTMSAVDFHLFSGLCDPVLCFTSYVILNPFPIPFSILLLHSALPPSFSYYSFTPPPCEKHAFSLEPSLLFSISGSIECTESVLYFIANIHL